MSDLSEMVEAMRARSEAERALLDSILTLNRIVRSVPLNSLNNDVRKTFADMVRAIGADIGGTHH